MKTLIKYLAPFFVCAPLFAGTPPYPGNLKPHGHTSTADGGVLNGFNLYGYANVKDPQFAGGAKGNNTADDRPAIQAAINYVHNLSPVVGGMVYLPPGVYKMITTSGTFNLPGDDGTVNAGYGNTLAGETVSTMSYCLRLWSNVRLVGAEQHSTYIKGLYNYRISSVDNTQPVLILLGDGSGGNFQVEHLQILSAFIGFYEEGIAQGYIRHVTFSNVAIPDVIQTTEQFQFDDIHIGASGAGLTVGGWWKQRNNLQDVSGGYADKTEFKGVVNQNFLVNHSTYEDLVDAWFDTYIYKSTNSVTGVGFTSTPAVSFDGSCTATANAAVDTFRGVVTEVNVTSAGTGCVSTTTVSFSGGGGNSAHATIVVDSSSHTTGVSISRLSAPQGGQFADNVPYRGITGTGIVIMSRYGRASFGTHISDQFHYGGSRYAIYGGPEYSWMMENIKLERVGYTDDTHTSVYGVLPATNPYYNARIAAGIEVIPSGNSSTLIGFESDYLAAKFPVETVPNQIGVFSQASANPDLQNPNVASVNIPQRVNVSSNMPTAVNAGNSTEFKNYARVTLPIGYWSCSGYFTMNGNSAVTWTLAGIAISAFADNTTTDQISGTNQVTWSSGATPFLGGAILPLTIPSFPVVTTTPTVYYLKGRADYASGGPPQMFRGTLSCDSK